MFIHNKNKSLTVKEEKQQHYLDLALGANSGMNESKLSPVQYTEEGLWMRKKHDLQGEVPTENLGLMLIE